MDNETITLEDRLYVNPEVSRAEQDAFLDKFRNIQAQNQAQINRDTYNLGTPVSSNLGGLTGADGRWNTQYQRPQVNAAIENLRQVNLQQAVNTAMQNQQNAIGERLNQAKRAYYRAQQEASARDRVNANKPSNQPDANSGLPINTNTGNNVSDLAVRENEASRQEYENTNQEQFNETMQDVINEIQSGNYNTANTVAFSYIVDGKPVYGEVYRDAFGNITGVKTPEANYNGASGKQWLLNQARSGNLKNSAGQNMTDLNVLFGV